MNRFAPRLALLLCVTCPMFCGAVAYLRLDSGIIEQRLKLSPADAQARLHLLRTQFREAGCESKYIQEQTLPGETLPNISCTLPGSAKGIIVIAAPLESQSDPQSAWPTVAMLPLLAESLNGSSHRCSFVLIAFAGHDDHSGVPAYLSHLPQASRSSIVAAVDLEQLGWAATYAFPGPVATQEQRIGRRTIEVKATHDESPISQLLLAAADTLKISRPDPSADPSPMSLAEEFERANISTLIVTSPNYVALKRFDGSAVRVQQTKLDLKAYYQTYNLLCVFGLHLDQAFGTDRNKVNEPAVAGSQISDHLLLVINGVRAGAKLPPLKLDPRVTEDAKGQAAAFASNKRLNGDEIERRLSKLGLMSANASEVWFVLPEEASKDDALIRESIGADAQRNFVDPNFTVAGIAAVHRGKSYFAVVNLLLPLSNESSSDAEAALLKAIQQERGKSGLPEFEIATASAALRDIACSMAKQDSLQVGVDGVKAPKVFAFTSGDPARSSWVQQIATFGPTPGASPKINLPKVTIGICRSGSASSTNETFWVIVQLDHSQ